MSLKYPHIKVQLTGTNGNAFAVLGKCQAAMKKAVLGKIEIEEFVEAATASDYDHLLQTTMKYFDVL